MSKRMLDYNGIELRIQARSRSSTTRDAAKAELRRRVGNLRGGVVPAWERELRGQDPRDWAVV